MDGSGRKPRARLRWFQFSLRTLLATALLVGPISSWLGPWVVGLVREWRAEQRQQQLIFTEQDIRKLVEEWERLWNPPQPDKPLPRRTHGGVI
jgi:4-amino-4-deoxy-L-arabinose transferase-like glycosyltransferase